MSRHHGVLFCVFLATSPAVFAACSDDGLPGGGSGAAASSAATTGGAGGTGEEGGAGGAGGAGGGHPGVGSGGMGGAVGGAGGTGGVPMLDPQRPPTDPDVLKDWVIARPFDSWNCETTEYDDGSSTRNCTNDLLSDTTLAEGEEWPEGVAGVVEARDADGFISDPGLILSLKTKPQSDGGASWLWHHQLGDEVMETGFGPGGAVQVCNDCHISGTPDATPLDFVFRPIPPAAPDALQDGHATLRYHR